MDGASISFMKNYLIGVLKRMVKFMRLNMLIITYIFI